MTVSVEDQVLARWATQDLAEVATAALAADILALRQLIARLEAEFTRRLAVFDARNGAAADGLSTVAWLRHRCHLSPGDAAARAATARRLPDFPALAAAFAAGAVSEPHVRAVTLVRDDAARSAVAAVDGPLASAATNVSPIHLRRMVEHVVQAAAPDVAARDARALRERRWLVMSQTFDGAWALDGLLDPEAGATVRAALDAVMAGDRGAGDGRTPGQARADALTTLARHALDAGDLPIVAGERPHLVVQVPVAVLAPPKSASTEPRGDGGEGEQAAALPRVAATLGVAPGAATLTRDAVRRIGCDAKVTRVLLGGESLPLDVGRASRVVPPQLRRALEARDGGCTWPGCDRPPHWTEAHHVRHWADGGETALDNLVLLCARHHHAVHEGRAPCPAPRTTSPASRDGP